MAKRHILIVTLATLAMIVAGCSNQSGPTAPIDGSAFQLSSAIPPGATLTSASLNLYVWQVSDKTVNAHRVTADWDEMVITWNNFGGAFDAAVEASLLVDAGGYHSFDVTALVQAWLDGTHPNYGFLLEQGTTFPRSIFISREHADASMNPFLEVCYMMGGVEVCEELPAIADAEFWEGAPDDNYGASGTLRTGWQLATDWEKQSVIRFDLPVTPPLAGLGDYVWHDENRDGIQDRDELGVEGVTVYLYDCADAQTAIGSTVTDAAGWYQFINLQPGDYFVEFIAPAGWVITLQDQGADDAVDSDADRMTGRTICTTLDAGEYDPTWDAGIYEPQNEGCTGTIGYWKTHAGFGPQADVVTPLLPLWLGTPGGADSRLIDDAQYAYDILSQDVYGDPSNGITKLYAQLLGTKLNIANGATSTVDDVIADADAFLADHDYTAWDSMSKPDQKEVLRWARTFDRYNNGYLGTPHCD